jgi:hypothetical protein
MGAASSAAGASVSMGASPLAAGTSATGSTGAGLGLDMTGLQKRSTVAVRAVISLVSTASGACFASAACWAILSASHALASVHSLATWCGERESGAGETRKQREREGV